MLRVAADRHFPTNFCQKAASASPNSCTEPRGNFTAVSVFIGVRHPGQPSLSSDASVRAQLIDNSFSRIQILHWVLSHSRCQAGAKVCVTADRIQEQREKQQPFTQPSHVLHLNKDLQYFKLI